MSEQSISQNTADNTDDDLDILYKIDDPMPLGMAILLGLQHILAAFGGIVAVPLVVANALGLPIEDVAYFVSAAIFVAGVATYIQAKGIGPVGARVPCVMGTDFTFVAPLIAIGTTMGIPVMFGGAILGSFIEMILSRFIKPLMRFFPPIVTGTVVCLIGLTLIPVSMDWAAGGFGSENYGSLKNIALAAIVLVIILGLNHYSKGMFSSASVLIGLVIGYVIAYPLGMLNLEAVSSASWFAFPKFLKYGVTFRLSAVVPFIAAYLVTSIETIGCLIAVGEASGKELTHDEIGAGILADGVGSFIAGFFGASPNTSFSQNVGLITMTKVASRFVVIIAGIILMVMGIFPKLGAVVAIMPQPVLGGAGIVMFGMVAASGIKTLSRVKMDNRNLLIIAVSLALGLGVTVRPEIINNLPTGLQMLFSSGISTGTIAALMMNMLLRDKKVKETNEVVVKKVKVAAN